MDGESDQQTFTISQLTELTGVSRRTIRFYVEKGVLTPPRGAGRGARYTREHLQRLRFLSEGRDRNLTLDELARFSAQPATAHGHAAGDNAASSTPPRAHTERWIRSIAAPGIELHVREGDYTETERGALELALRATLKKLRGPEKAPPEEEKKK